MTTPVENLGKARGPFSAILIDAARASLLRVRRFKIIMIAHGRENGGRSSRTHASTGFTDTHPT